MCDRAPAPRCPEAPRGFLREGGWELCRRRLGYGSADRQNPAGVSSKHNVCEANNCLRQPSIALMCNDLERPWMYCPEDAQFWKSEFCSGLGTTSAMASTWHPFAKITSQDLPDSRGSLTRGPGRFLLTGHEFCPMELTLFRHAQRLLLMEKGVGHTAQTLLLPSDYLSLRKQSHLHEEKSILHMEQRLFLMGQRPFHAAKTSFLMEKRRKSSPDGSIGRGKPPIPRGNQRDCRILERCYAATAIACGISS